ncbi:ABC transporter substrate-binding protein [Sphingobium phenoxybenzoativorans]|uniref:ABC transporter substrate-binding protein n=1 Tax=Sphingobium phenoxybenzoativorans TaxID=1592790 RepID=A0A975Q3H3_9SPHN|nr:ABC transporter substrate-binding protein [Sphingobium phenoxybenzoativorans]QUT07527.1 ABC transporter substrate-binding protein [Sphingobium phenoxybenzoativorans]
MGAILRLCLLSVLFASLSGAANAESRPRRILSLNMCADQLLIALADPSQILALTQFARDRDMSAEAERADHFAMSRGASEDVLALEPDLIISSPFHAIGPQVKKRNYRTINLNPAENYPAIVTQIRQVAAAVGHPERGEAMIGRMDAELKGLRRIKGAPIAAYYQRRGYLTGTGTLIDDLMQRVGLRNLATAMGRPVLSRMSVEEMVAARPDYLIVETNSDRIADQGTEMLHHPALAGIPRLRLPQAWTVCGGPAYVLAAKSLSEQLRAHR